MSKTVPFRTFGTMIDCSRNAVLNLKTAKKWIDLTASLGYNLLMLYTEDTYEVDGEPYFGSMRGRYTHDELRALDAYAREKGMTLMPCIQTLAHLQTIKRWPPYCGHFDTADILLAEDARVYELIEHMFASLAKDFTCRTVHIGMDEAEMFGRGQYYDLHGECDRSKALLAHLNRVCEIAKKYGFRCIMWSDMFFKQASGGRYYDADAAIGEEVRKRIPSGLELVYWDYYSLEKPHYDKMIAAHQKLKDGTWFAGGLWKWTGYAPHNGFSIRSMREAVASCREKGVQDVFMTLWGDDGGECSPFTLLPSLFYVSEIAKGETDESVIAAHFAERFGVSFADFMQADLLGTKNGRNDAYCNPDKYLLYNDPFTGMMDSAVDAGEGAQFGACADKLEALAAQPEWGYLFRSLGALCRLLEVKAELGVRTREAYRRADKAALSALVADYDETEKRLTAFYEAYRAQWMAENKPHGFDVQDIRLGGLMQRIRSCRARLRDYCLGTLDRIEELEEDAPDFFDGGKRMPWPVVAHWGVIATANAAYAQYIGF